jgi:hypothetical protein
MNSFGGFSLSENLFYFNVGSIKKEAFCPKAKGDLNYSFFLCSIAPITGAVKN